MWIKRFTNGTEIRENRDQGITWMKTPLTGLISVELVNLNRYGQAVHCWALRGMREYWHSRTALVREDVPARVIAERIQGLQSDGGWLTITWNGDTYIETIEPRAYGKPAGS